MTDTLIDCVADALWEETPTHCEVTWTEAKRLAESDKKIGLSSWVDAVEDHRRLASVAIKAYEKAKPRKVPAIERGTIEHLVKREIPHLLLGLAELDREDVNEVIVIDEFVTEIENALERACGQLEAVMERDAGGRWGKPIEVPGPKSVSVPESMKNFGKPSQECLDDIVKINRNVTK